MKEKKKKVRKMVSFDSGSSTLRLELCWPPSIGVGSSEVMSFDWDFGRGEVLSFDWAKAAASGILRLGVRASEVLSFDWPVSQCVAKSFDSALLPSSTED